MCIYRRRVAAAKPKESEKNTMSETLIYKGRGSAEMFDDYIDFINYVFGMNGTSEGFPKLLPKLYKPEYHPCENNYVVTVDGKLKSAIGVFPRTFDIMGEKLVSWGIGNVAVHPYSRSKGYMRELLHTAVDEMIASGADMSDLGGLRQRYAYFSYESASPVAKYYITGTSVRHCFGGSPLRELDFREVCENDPLLDDIIALHQKRICHAERPDDEFLDIARSWSKNLYAVLDGEKLLGYFIGDLCELTLIDNGDFDDVVRNYIAKRGNVTITLPLYETDLLNRAERIADGVSMGNDQNYTIFHFAKVVGAYMKLKAKTAGLVDGTLSVTVNGIAGTEKFRIDVKNGTPEITTIDGDTDLTLDHLEAVAFFFSLSSAARRANPLAAAWFPLPLFIESADHV